MIALGKVQPGTTIYIPFETFASSTGAPITMSNFAVGDILVYKDGSMTQRASTSGFTLLDTDGIDLDTITGIHGFSIDLSDNTTADFWASGSKYFVVVSTVTVDSQTMSFVAATFRIGEEGSILDTTIATLSSQTSFTLTNGPADNSALVGCVAVIHDAASAVQQCLGVVSAYTGSTKTVTLLNDPGVFTMAAKDNISFMPDRSLKPATDNRTVVVDSAGLVDANAVKVGPTGSGTAQTARDIGASVLLSSGTGTGQLDFTSGVVKGNVTQLLGTAWLTPGTAGTPDVNVKLISADATAADNAEAFFDGTGYAGTNNVIPTVTTLTNDPTGVTTLLSRIPSGIFTGITSLAQWLGLIAGKQTGNTTARTELRATGAGSGTFDETTDSIEAIRDRGDAAWTTATGFSTHSAADVWAVATRVLTAGTNIVLAKGTGVTGFNDIAATAIVSAGAITTSGGAVSTVTDVTNLHASAATAANQTTILARLGSFAGSGVNTVLGMFKALLSKTASTPSDVGGTFDPSTDSTEAIRDRGDAAWVTATSVTVSDKTGFKLAGDGLDLVLIDGKTLPAAVQYIAASTAGKISGAGTGTEIAKGLDGTTTRLTITVDASGNRSAITYG